MLLRTAVAVGLLAGAWTAKPAPAAAATPDHPNIVVIMADDQDDMGSINQMPQLQALAARGVTFTNSFVNYSLCCPSRASFLTAQSAHNSGVRGNKLPDGGYQKLAPTEDNTLGVWLQAAGYRTGIMGKLMNGYGQNGLESRKHIMPGWDEWDIEASPHGDYRYFGYTLNENGTLVRYHHTPYDYQTDVIAAKGESFIRKSADQPFFLLLESIAPHGTQNDDGDDGESGGEARGIPDVAPRYANTYATLPFKKSRNFNEKKIEDKPQAFQANLDGFIDEGEATQSFRARREAMLAVDDTIKRVVDTLTETGQLDNTYIIVTSDNGYSEGSHRWQGKIVLYDESIRVPLVIAGPGVPRGVTRSQLVNNLDVVASILDWTKATPGRTPDGRSLSPLMSDGHAPWRTALLVENKHTQGIRTDSWMYAESTTVAYGLEKEIYDLRHDPLELTNQTQSGDPGIQAAQSQFGTLLQTLKSCVGDGCWVDGNTPQANAAVPAR